MLLSYQHEALGEGEIRLLRLSPVATAEENFHGELRNCRLTPDMHCEAISYVWEGPVFGHS
jgi:hypothetical protein